MNRFRRASCAVCQVRIRAGPGWKQSFIAISGALQGILLMLEIHPHPINNYVIQFAEFILIWSFIRDMFI